MIPVQQNEILLLQQQFYQQGTGDYLNYNSIHTAPQQIESSNYFHSGISWQKTKYYQRGDDCCSEM